MQFKLSLKNIGPHKNLEFNNDISKLQFAIYGRNGQGKTFISRCFRMFSLENDTQSEHSKDLHRIGTTVSDFQVKLDEKEASFNINNNSIVNMVNNTDRKFHVFNSDYVLDNFVYKDYIPNSQIEGVILGKGNIDLSLEKQKLIGLMEKGTLIKSNIEKEIMELKNSIKKYGITSNLNAFKNINYDTLKSYKTNDTDLQEYELKMKGLDEVSDSLNDWSIPYFDISSLINFEDVTAILQTSFTLNYYEDEFKKYISDNLNFIEDGLKIYQKNNDYCPYCKQKLSNASLDLINQYISYVNDQEAKIIKEIEEYIRIIKIIEDKLKRLKENYKLFEEQIKLYDKHFGPFNFEVLNSVIYILNNYIEKQNEIKNLLVEKKINLTKPIFFSNNVNYQEKLTQSVILLQKEVNSFNKRKNESNKIKTDYRKKICEGCMNKLKKDFDKDFLELNSLREDISKLKTEIQRKETVNRKEKKELIANDLENYLKTFFYDKYKLDKTSFEISLAENEHTKLNKSMSDGEKNILAFCYYLASIHQIVSNENEYEKIVLIVDDPISSMDIQYTYQMISLLKKYLKLRNESNPKYIILTHNLEFYNILQRNNMIPEKNLLILNEKLEKYNNDLLMPYEFHLKDIYEVAEKGVAPYHTIPNSIRHVLETISQFEGYSKHSKELYNWIADNQHLQNNMELYTFMQDLSHGNVRFDLAYSPELLKKGCVAVIHFMRDKYPKQIEKLANILGENQ